MSEQESKKQVQIIIRSRASSGADITKAMCEYFREFTIPNVKSYKKPPSLVDTSVVFFGKPL